MQLEQNRAFRGENNKLGHKIYNFFEPFLSQTFENFQIFTFTNIEVTKSTIGSIYP